jgi:glycosyltransferase involved in cell wall biosynthesis
MRNGMNPNREAHIRGWGKYVASAIVHLPELSGYHEQRFEVVQTSLTTMRENAGVDAQTLIWDNGSCPELRDWLLNEYKPDGLILSPNIGLSSARASVLRMLPPQTIVNVADDDIYYYPDWFRASLEILNTYPNVGQVSGYPVRTQFRWGCTNTKNWARQRALLEVGRYIPEQWDKDFCTSIGRDYDWHKGYTRDNMDYRVTFQGLKAYAVAHHCQFICRAENIAPFALFTIEAMSDDKDFDNRVDASGLLRLTTINRYTRHIGNVLDAELKPKRRRK